MATALKPPARRVRSRWGVPYPKTRWIVPVAYAIWIAPYVASGFVLPTGLLWWLTRMVLLGLLIAATASGLHLLVWRRWAKRMTPDKIREITERTVRARCDNAWLN